MAAEGISSLGHTALFGPKIPLDPPFAKGEEVPKFRRSGDAGLGWKLRA